MRKQDALLWRSFICACLLMLWCWFRCSGNVVLVPFQRYLFAQTGLVEPTCDTRLKYDDKQFLRCRSLTVFYANSANVQDSGFKVPLQAWSDMNWNWVKYEFSASCNAYRWYLWHRNIAQQDVKQARSKFQAPDRPHEVASGVSYSPGMTKRDRVQRQGSGAAGSRSCSASYFASLAPHDQAQRVPCYTNDLKRKEANLLLGIRTDSASRGSVVHRLGRR